MPRGSGSFIIAFVAIALSAMLFFGGLANQNNQRDAHQDRAEQYSERSETYLPCDRRTAFSPDCAPDANPNPNRKEYREEQDLKAQQGMWEWTRNMSVVAFFGFCVSILGVVLLYLNLHDTRRAAIQHQRIGISDVRAYLQVEDFTTNIMPYFAGGFVSRNNTLDLRYRYSLKNVGSTPARNVRIKIWTRDIGTSAGTNAGNVLDDMISHADRFSLNFKDFGVIATNELIANQEWRDPVFELREISANDIANQNGTFGVATVMKIVYEDVFHPNEPERELVVAAVCRITNTQVGLMPMQHRYHSKDTST